MKALVLSAGGMFGAYQAGVWQGLSDWFKPDIVVGSSIGALNGWAIAGGCRSEELTQRWLNLEALRSWRVRWPWPPLTGLLDCGSLEKTLQEVSSAYVPERRFGIVLTEVRGMKPRLFTKNIGWEHLAASTAIPFLFNQRQIDGKLYTDGGLLNSLPVWAAVEMGATRILAVQVLPYMPDLLIRNFVKTFRALAPKPPRTPGSPQVVTLGSPRPLGRARDMLEWDFERAARWVEQGRTEALEKRHSLQQMFWE